MCTTLKMIRLFIALAVFHAAAAAVEIDESILEQIFGIRGDDDNEVVSQCESLEGKGRGCYECRYCNDSLVQGSRYSASRVELQLKDSTCMEEQVLCCVVQKDILGLKSTENCGRSNPDGIPRKRRSAPRAVLQGEFPWRAWVYKKNSATPLCAATFVQDTLAFEALLTLASCVHGNSADSLEVAFARGGQRSALRSIIQHEGYRPGQEANNIAILRLRSGESIPRWAAPACLPPAAPGHAAPCLATSSGDIRVSHSPLPLTEHGDPAAQGVRRGGGPVADVRRGARRRLPPREGGGALLQGTVREKASVHRARAGRGEAGRRGAHVRQRLALQPVARPEAGGPVDHTSYNNSLEIRVATHFCRDRLESETFRYLYGLDHKKAYLLNVPREPGIITCNRLILL